MSCEQIPTVGEDSKYDGKLKAYSQNSEEMTEELEK